MKAPRVRSLALGSIAILLCIGMFVVIRGRKMNPEGGSSLSLYVGFAEPLEEADPRSIRYRSEFNFLRMLYSPLIGYEASGALKSELAEDFYWKDNQAHFHIRKNAKTSLGEPVTFDDVAASFSRLGVQQGGTHGSLLDFMCEADQATSHCLKLEKVSDTHFYIQFNGRSEFLFRLLSSMDYVIIPKRALDPKTGRIIDHTNTTGPYFLDKVSRNPNQILSANKSHWLWNNSMPEEVEVIYNHAEKERLTPLDVVFQKLLDGKIDLIPTYAFIP
ncbi:hypothetical protein EBR21_13140, partial [bacterium]|nr:hypothetical protein [bacterium]